MASQSDILAQTERLEAVFTATGAMVIKADILQPADTLLDLYGEDIRARAFVTHDPLGGEHMLRPDFTVPVVQMHMADGAEPARYTYSGKVFRRQESDPSRPNEYVQVGYEVFDRADPAGADAEVFSLFAKALEPFDVTPITGDIGILMAAVQGLKTTDRRKAALLRHIWRPERFRALLERFGGMAPVPETRTALLAKVDPLAEAGEVVGLRRTEEIEARINALRQDAIDPPISGAEVALLDRILTLRGSCSEVRETLVAMVDEMPSLSQSVAQFGARLTALQDRGIDADTLAFQASFGRSTMEYYDGFVFGFYLKKQGDGTPVATGGRYDALTRVLGNGRSIPAVGGVIRPDLVVGAGQ